MDSVTESRPVLLELKPGEAEWLRGYIFGFVNTWPGCVAERESATPVLRKLDTAMKGEAQELTGAS